MRARQEKRKQGPSRNAGQRFRAKIRAEGCKLSTLAGASMQAAAP